MPSPAGRNDVAAQDRHLLSAARAGDGNAYATFFRRHSDDVTGYLYRRTLCPHTAADLMAETFAQALTNLDRYRPDRGEPRAWLFGIAANQLAQWLRSGAVEQRARRRLGMARTTDPTAEDLERIDRLIDVDAYREQLLGALDSLSANIREAVLLRVADDLPYEIIAERLNCTPGAARVRVSRGIAHLHQSFGGTTS